VVGAEPLDLIPEAVFILGIKESFVLDTVAEQLAGFFLNLVFSPLEECEVERSFVFDVPGPAVPIGGVNILPDVAEQSPVAGLVDVVERIDDE